MQQHIFGFAKPWLATLAVVVTVLFWSDARAQELEKIIQGYKIAPVTLNLKGKDWALVGLGSYLVNTTGCNDCHTFPNWATGGNPFLGEPEQINTDRYLVRCFQNNAPMGSRCIVDFVAPSVDDWLAIDVVDEGQQSFLEFVFGVDADVAQDRTRQLGEEALNEIEP